MPGDVAREIITITPSRINVVRVREVRFIAPVSSRALANICRPDCKTWKK
jgi:hypothetical protein